MSPFCVTSMSPLCHLCVASVSPLLGSSQVAVWQRLGLIKEPTATPEAGAPAADEEEGDAATEAAPTRAPRGARADGRSATTIRPLRAVTDVLPMTHGSSMFERGMTQIVASVTLGQAPDAQLNRSALDGALPARPDAEVRSARSVTYSGLGTRGASHTHTHNHTHTHTHTHTQTHTHTHKRRGAFASVGSAPARCAPP